MQAEGKKPVEEVQPKRILGRLLAQELTEAELGEVSGGMRPRYTCCQGDWVVYCYDDCG